MVSLFSLPITMILNISLNEFLSSLQLKEPTENHPLQYGFYCKLDFSFIFPQMWHFIPTCLPSFMSFTLDEVPFLSLAVQLTF